MWNLTWQWSCCTSDLMGFHCLHLGLQKQQTYPTIAWFSWYVSKLCHTVFSLVSFVSLGFNITNWTWMLSTLEMVYESMDTFAPQGEWKRFTMTPWAKLCSFREWEHVSHLALCRWNCRWFWHFMLAFCCSGAQSKTLMLVHVSPKVKDIRETVCSLSFASRARGTHLGCEISQVCQMLKELFALLWAAAAATGCLPCKLAIITSCWEKQWFSKKLLEFCRKASMNEISLFTVFSSCKWCRKEREKKQQWLRSFTGWWTFTTMNARAYEQVSRPSRHLWKKGKCCSHKPYKEIQISLLVAEICQFRPVSSLHLPKHVPKLW